MTHRTLGDVVGTDLHTGHWETHFFGKLSWGFYCYISLYQVDIKLSSTRAMDEEGVNLIRRKIIICPAMMLNIEGTGSRGQKGPVFIALAKISEAWKALKSALRLSQSL